MSVIDSKTTTTREANVLLELIAQTPMSTDVLDANSDDVLEAVQGRAAGIALGPTISLRTVDASILLRFDLLIQSESDAYRQLAQVMEIIELHTGLHFERGRTVIELSPSEDEQPIAC